MNKRHSLAIVFALCAATVAHGQDGTWRPVAPMVGPTTNTINRQSHASATTGGYVYVFGGQKAGTTPTVHSALRYDPVAESWFQINGIAIGSTWVACAGCAFGGEIYQFGGGTTGLFPTIAQVWKFTPAVNGWTQLTSLPKPLTGAQAAATSSRIFVTGGLTGSSFGDYAIVRTNYEFDPAGAGGLGTWTESVLLPDQDGRGNGIYMHYMQSIDGRLYVAGGYNPAVGTGQVWSFDPANPNAGWLARAPMPSRNSSSGSCVANGHMYIFGGNYGGSLTLDYDPAGDRWSTRAPIAAARYGNAATTCTVNGFEKCYVTGGWVNGVLSNVTDEYTPPSPPLATGVFMRAPGGLPLAEGAWIGGTTIEFGATLTDSENDNVRLQVEVIPAGAPFTGAPTISGPLVPPGLVVTSFTALTSGTWKWRYRAADSAGFVGPWAEFGTAAPDFNVDQTPPTDPQSIAPQGRIRTNQRHGTPVHFEWTASTDNRGGPVSYRVQYSTDPSFLTAVTAAMVTTTTWDPVVPPNVDDTTYSWRVQALDDLGNPSAWSPALSFDVYFDDQIDHGAGDGIGCSVGAHSSGSLVVVILLAALLSRRVR